MVALVVYTIYTLKIDHFARVGSRVIVTSSLQINLSCICSVSVLTPSATEGVCPEEV